MTRESINAIEEKKIRKFPYVLCLLSAFCVFVVSLLDPSISGIKKVLICLCMGIATSISALKLRNLIHGIGWVFPQTNTVLLWTISVEIFLYLWFSH